MVRHTPRVLETAIESQLQDVFKLYQVSGFTNPEEIDVYCKNEIVNYGAKLFALGFQTFRDLELMDPRCMSFICNLQINFDECVVNKASSDTEGGKEPISAQDITPQKLLSILFLDKGNRIMISALSIDLACKKKEVHDSRKPHVDSDKVGIQGITKIDDLTYDEASKESEDYKYSLVQNASFLHNELKLTDQEILTLNYAQLAMLCRMRHCIKYLLDNKYLDIRGLGFLIQQTSLASDADIKEFDQINKFSTICYYLILYMS